MDHLSELIRISRYFGSDPEYVLAGGGNSSFKNRDHLWIKSSGIALSNIDRDGFICLDRRKLGRIAEKKYPRNTSERESTIARELLSSAVGEVSGRPSVETSLHNLFDHRFIVHTHPTTVNALLCSKRAEEKSRDMFGDELLFIEYTDPGYSLFIKTAGRLDKFRSENEREPQVIFLQNHGLIVGGNSFEEIRDISDRIMDRIKAEFRVSLPAAGRVEISSADEVVRTLDKWLGEAGMHLECRSNALIDHFIAGRERFDTVSRPFTPDDIVYCRSRYLFVDNDADETARALGAFRKDYGYYPQVIAIKGLCLVAAGGSVKSASAAMDVFVNMMKIGYLSDNFGGPRFLADAEIAFVENWEAENYRKSIM